jgi:Flp pilus assembly protein TadD
MAHRDVLREMPDLLPILIHARTAIKTGQTDEALSTIRKLIELIDPDKSHRRAAGLLRS